MGAVISDEEYKQLLFYKSNWMDRQREINRLRAEAAQPITVFVCFELNALDVPKLCAVHTVGPALKWLDDDRANRYIMPMGVDVKPYQWPAADLFEWAGVEVEE